MIPKAVFSFHIFVVTSLDLYAVVKAMEEWLKQMLPDLLSCSGHEGDTGLNLECHVTMVQDGMGRSNVLVVNSYPFYHIQIRSFQLNYLC